MTFFGITLSIAIILAFFCIFTYLIEWAIKKVWEVEEFTGNFWKVLLFIRKLFLCLAVVCASVAAFAGILYLIILAFNTGLFRG